MSADRETEFLAPRGDFSKKCPPLELSKCAMISASIAPAFVVHDTRTIPHSAWGRKARREGGGLYFHARGRQRRSHGRRLPGLHSEQERDEQPARRRDTASDTRRLHSERMSPHGVKGDTHGRHIRRRDTASDTRTHAPQAVGISVSPSEARRDAFSGVLPDAYDSGRESRYHSERRKTQ